MKHKFLSLLLVLSLLLTLLSGCDIRIRMEDSKPRIDADMEDLGEFLEDGQIDLQFGNGGPKINIDLGSLLSEEEEIHDAESFLSLPPYTGSPYVSVNGNVPYFSADEITEQSFEFYSELDSLGRCGVTYASIGRDLMPTEKRESIQEVRPTGWVQNQYDWVDGESLYNRCHLIGFQLAGENANEKNLITGTRSMNIHGMLPFENMVADYVKETGNHVMYRVTPVFNGRNLVADGVLMEGLSVEDHGDGITFCVFAYNAEPGVVIDYATGENHAEKAVHADAKQEANTYILNTGSKKFHLPSCSGARNMSESHKKVYEGSRQDLIDQGYKPCGRCKP